MNLNSIIAPDFKSLLVTLSNEGINNLILDVSNVKFIDSSGLSAILTANRLWRNSGNFVLVGAIHESVKKLFEISSLNTVVNIRRDVTDGIEFIIFENNDVEVEY
ncbi:MAG: STAS domain-containing protein [Lewinella sp.]|nr:STAS domain-containing protein [Lewinella sp.]